jgi:hypothetical protein
LELSAQFAVLTQGSRLSGLDLEAERFALDDSFEGDPSAEAEGGVGVGPKTDGLAIGPVEVDLEALADEVDAVIADAEEADVLVGVEEVAEPRLGEANEGSVLRFLGELWAVEDQELLLHGGVIGAT